MTENLQGWLQEYTLLIYDIIDSTNEEAKRLAIDGIEGNHAIWAESQTQGHGRYGRHWVSPPGNLYLSLLLRPEHDVATASQLAFVAAVAMADTVSFFLSTSARIGYKWPNDIMVENKKIGGVLLESRLKAGSNSLDWLIIGVGINIIDHPELLAERTGYEATSLQKEGAEIPSVSAVLYKFMQSFTANCAKWKKNGFSPLKELFLEKALNVGRTITVRTADSRLSGVFTGINDDGCLLLTLEGGHQHVITVGDLFFEHKQQQSW